MHILDIPTSLPLLSFCQLLYGSLTPACPTCTHTGGRQFDPMVTSDPHPFCVHAHYLPSFYPFYSSHALCFCCCLCADREDVEEPSAIPRNLPPQCQLLPDTHTHTGRSNCHTCHLSLVFPFTCETFPPFYCPSCLPFTHLVCPHPIPHIPHNI